MIERLRITVLADNSVAHPDLLGEHGLSMLIEADGRRVLFDTGQGRVLAQNVEALGADLSELDAVVLSHGHYDHAGGLAAALRLSSPAAVFLHPAAMEPKYARLPGSVTRQVGMPAACRQALEASRGRLVRTERATEVMPGMWCTGEIPRADAGQRVETSFYLDSACGAPDTLVDDQALCIETANGLVVVAGCTHSGIANTLRYVFKLANPAFLAFIGGLHLRRADQGELEAGGDAIGACNFPLLAPCHCTGAGGFSYLRARFRSLVHEGGSGARFTFGEQ